MLRLLASQPISVRAFVVDGLLAPLSRPGCRGGFLVLGQPYAKSSWARLTTSFRSSALTLLKTARRVKLSVASDVGVRSTPSLSPMLKRCSTPVVLQAHTRYLVTTGCKESNISPAFARTSLLLSTVCPRLLNAALRDVLDGLRCWSVSGNLTSQGLRIH